MSRGRPRRSSPDRSPRGPSNRGPSNRDPSNRGQSARGRSAPGRNRLRLTGGEYGGRLLAVPAGVRPTEGRVREALLSIWGPRLAGARLLDLFAGSGAVALEALGRGALEAVAVEGDEAVAATLLDNLRTLAASGLEIRRAELPLELRRMARQGAGPFDLAFADPPYRFSAHAGLLRDVEPLLAAEGELAVEHSRRAELPLTSGGLVRVDARRYGESALSFYRRSPQGEPG